MGTHDDLRWHNDGRPARPKRQPCSIQPCDACVEDGIVPGPNKNLYNWDTMPVSWAETPTQLDYTLPKDYSVELRDQVEVAVKANLGSIGNTTDAVMDVLRTWIGEHCD